VAPLIGQGIQYKEWVGWPVTVRESVHL
jgi:hypothetical protein